jgi:hypothetical protein
VYRGRGENIRTGTDVNIYFSSPGDLEISVLLYACWQHHATALSLAARHCSCVVCFAKWMLCYVLACHE